MAERTGKAFGRPADGYKRECPVCGLRWAARGNRAKYCSVACRLWATSHPGERRARTNTCATCGRETNNRRSRYCSPECRSSQRPNGRSRTLPRSVRQRTAACDFCGEKFTTSLTLRRYCSEWCSDIATNQPGTYDRRRGRRCPWCGIELPITARLNRRFCCVPCQNKHNQAQRRARRRGRPSEFIDRYSIFERDGWVCHICGDPIDPSLGDRHPMSASIDHLVPLADPSSPGHVPSNVAAAHLRCNISKGAGALVGR